MGVFCLAGPVQRGVFEANGDYRLGEVETDIGKLTGASCLLRISLSPPGLR